MMQKYQNWKKNILLLLITISSWVRQSIGKIGKDKTKKVNEYDLNEKKKINNKIRDKDISYKSRINIRAR